MTNGPAGNVALCRFRRGQAETSMENSACVLSYFDDLLRIFSLVFNRTFYAKPSVTKFQALRCRWHREGYDMERIVLKRSTLGIQCQTIRHNIFRALRKGLKLLRKMAVANADGL
jgi:hypothetical protein